METLQNKRPVKWLLDQTARLSLHSIRVRLVSAFALIALLTAALAGALGLARVYVVSSQYEAEYLVIYAELARDQARLLFEDPNASSDQFQLLAEEIGRLGDLRVRIFETGGKVAADSGSPVPDLVFYPQATSQATPQTSIVVEAGSQGVRGTPLGVSTYAVTLIASTPRSERVYRAPVGEATAPVGMVEVSEAPDMVKRALTSLREAFATAALVAVVVALGAGWFAGNRLSAPLLELARAATEMRAGSLEARARVAGRDELGALADQFNRMAEQLQESFAALQAERDSLRRFVADASHELRTPLTALRMYNELLQGADGSHPGTRAEFLAENQAQIERLTWITENLLDLSRIDAGIAQLYLEPCPAGDLLQAVRAEFQARAAHQGVGLQVTLPDREFPVMCDRRRIEMVLSNLVDNAIKFSPAGGAVRIGCEAGPGQVHLWVSDGGPGIPPEDLPRLFEPFFRGSDRSIPGSGLGLAIVRSLVELHHGHVDAHNLPGEGARFDVWLPQDPQPR